MPPRATLPAAVALFVAKSAGVPLVINNATSGTPAIVASIIATAAASVAVGGWVSHSSGRSVWQGALRQLAIVVVVAAVTYTIGRVFGTAVA
jgi:VIT1/CCC1 family predicted Fe2+/Mn2+ transporter